MSDLRDEIALTINDYGDGLPGSLAREAADAIIDLIIARIPPLVWGHPSSANFKKGECFHTRSDANHYAVHKHRNGWWFNVDSKTYPTLEAAKAAANAHHVERLCKGMGIDTPPDLTHR